MIDFLPQLEDANMSFSFQSEQKLEVEVDIGFIVRLMGNVMQNRIFRK
ncbi:sensor histidine kinase domain protein [Bacillus clarus]|uniref:Sensor histidine kinase domain protein n=1 Tax=Bacillus clarus TaxID=2338372 RepID=A0A090YUS2_9BACI|nr:sensor histidine kinase domain protein [Bacillus clarus]